MSLSRATFLLSCYMLFSITLQAQQSPPTSIVPTSDPQAVAVVQRAVAALTRGATVSDVTLTGSAHRTAGSDDEMGTTTVTGTALGDSKVSLNFPSGPRTEIRNHSATPLPVSLPAGVTLAAAATQPQPVDVWSGADGVVYSMAQNVMTDPTWFFPAITLGKIAASPTWVLSYVGPETHDGISVVHVQAAQLIPAVANAPQQLVDTVRRLTRTDLYLDSSTLFPVALAFNTHPQENALIDIPTEIRFSNYQSIAGVAVPMQVQKYLNNGIVLDFQFTSAALNSGLSASAFAIQ